MFLQRKFYKNNFQVLHCGLLSAFYNIQGCYLWLEKAGLRHLKQRICSNGVQHQGATNLDKAADSSSCCIPHSVYCRRVRRFLLQRCLLIVFDFHSFQLFLHPFHLWKQLRLYFCVFLRDLLPSLSSQLESFHLRLRVLTHFSNIVQIIEVLVDSPLEFT